MGRFQIRQIRKWIGLILLWGGIVPTVQAQEVDYTTWLRQGVVYEVNERLDVSGGLEWRTKSHLRTTDRWGWT